MRPERHANIKAQMYFMLRQEFESSYKMSDNADAGLSIPDDKRLIHQLTMQKYRFDEKQRYKIESHVDLQRRRERSPDRADALAIANLLRVASQSQMINNRILEINLRDAQHVGPGACVYKADF